MGTNALHLLKQIEFLYREKHLPGRHNQKMHAPLKYLRGSGKVELSYRSTDRYLGAVEGYAKANADEERSARKALKRLGLSENDIHRMVSLKGLTAEVGIREYDGDYQDGVQVSVKYKDKDGNKVGEMRHSYGHRGYSSQKELMAHNELLVINNDSSMGGLATTLYANQIMTLKARKYDAVELYADISIGRYAWARKGFDYANGYDATFNRRRIVEFMDSHDVPHSGVDLSGLQHAKDFADFTVPGVTISKGRLDLPAEAKGDSFEVGKAFMLDRSDLGHGPWDGILRLQE